MRHLNKRDNFSAINDLRRLLNETKRLTLEQFVLPEDDEYGDNYGEYGDEEILNSRNQQPTDNNGVADIEKELIQIRKIALSVINRLADQTSSESYDTMKRIWSLVDKAIESKNDEDKDNKNMRRM